MARIIALSNQKGGVGKSVSTANLGIGLAREGKRVLIIDADPQASLTISLGFQRPDELPITLAHVMNSIMEDKPLDPMTGILHHAEDVDIMPASIELSGIEMSLVNFMSRETILRQYIQSLENQYEYVLLDTSPSLGMLTINALAAADSVIIPVQAEYLSAKGLETPASCDGLDQLNARLDANLADYHAHLLDFAPQELIDMAPRIAVMGEIHDYLKDRGFTEHETAYLLQFEKPLEIVADAWEAYRTDLGDIDYIVWGVCDRQDALAEGYTLAANAPISNKTAEHESFRDAMKPSIRQKLREAQEKSKAQAASEHKSQDKSKNDPII